MVGNGIGATQCLFFSIKKTGCMPDLLDDAGFRVFEDIILKSQANVFGKEIVMNCKFHPEVEAVTTCAVCGAGMCSACDTKAFFRMESGQPLCIECAFKEAEENVYFGENYLKGMRGRLFLASLFIILAIIFFILKENLYDEKFFLWGAIFWFFSGLVQTWGHEKDKGSIKSILWEGSGQEEGQLFRGIFKVIFYIFAGPVMLIQNFIKYPKLKVSHQLDVQKYEEIKAALDNAN